MKRRFIAGAVCPECGALDKIVRVEHGGTLWMECVACDMRKDLDAAPETPATQAAPGESKAVVWKPGKP
ncbi:YheV family putative metal-binding protein [Alcanivorax quisquiliarum]|uniref:YheV family putative metal-binding protein n=1 Tax=Alcanivorax quisquiliarum TaxID=2933565 RepID=A0ABT0E550_9GAMM|nr:YheV family putative metal-binding protein [Alcanivorax quisquiliarum]MCK0536950.1 YheV family putative metal-binding protein [Alcanivorax quisquiliarum]